MERQLAGFGDHRRGGLRRQGQSLGLQLFFLLRGLDTRRELGRGKARRDKAGAEQQRDVSTQNHGKPPRRFYHRLTPIIQPRHTIPSIPTVLWRIRRAAEVPFLVHQEESE